MMPELKVECLNSLISEEFFMNKQGIGANVGRTNVKQKQEENNVIKKIIVFLICCYFYHHFPFSTCTTNPVISQELALFCSSHLARHVGQT